MENLTVETRTFIGEPTTTVDDGYVGFRMNRVYQLQVESGEDETVAIVLDYHKHMSRRAGTLVVSNVGLV